MAEVLFFWIPGLSVSALIGYLLGDRKGRGAVGVLWGLLLGPLGWLIVAAGPDRRVKCRFCGGALVDFKVSHCRHCGKRIIRQKAVPISEAVDPVDAWEAREQANQEPYVPEHLRAK